MIDISHYCAKSDINPEISYVYIKNTGETLECVATDSYRLARIVYKFSEGDNTLLESLPSGLYVPQAFHNLCVTWNKKKATVTDKMNVIELLKLCTSTLKYKHFTMEQYPDYNQLIPTKDIVKSNDGLLGKYNAKYLIDHIELLARLKQDDYGSISIGEIYDSSKRMNVYHDKETGNTLLLMQVTR